MTTPQTKFVNGVNPFQTKEQSLLNFEARVLEQVKRYPLSKALDIAEFFGTGQKTYVGKVLHDMRQRGLVSYTQAHVRGGSAYLYSAN